jgi:positive regulator of sigma E activity
MTDTQARSIVLRAAALTGNEQAKARLEQDEHGTWLRMTAQLRTGDVTQMALVEKGMTEADLDEYLAKFIAMLAVASLDPAKALAVTSELFTLLEAAEAARALRTAPGAQA